MPAVSTKIRSNPELFNKRTVLSNAAEVAKWERRVASERIKTRESWIAFIRILSPNRAPPVLRFDGSTETIAIRFSGNSTRQLRTSSSVRQDFPAPPVPVKPITGTSDEES